MGVLGWAKNREGGKIFVRWLPTTVFFLKYTGKISKNWFTIIKNKGTYTEVT